jgi:Ca-dependent carbohydrate-binding module xylan-binding
VTVTETLAGIASSTATTNFSLNRTATASSTAAPTAVDTANTATAVNAAKAAKLSGPAPIATPPVTMGNGPDTLVLQVCEDAWKGDARFTVSVDGRQIGGVETATSLHSAGKTQTFDVLGSFAAGRHVVSVTFLNDAYGGTRATDRNLYVTPVTIDNSKISAATLSEYTQGPQSFSFLAPGKPGSGTIVNSATMSPPANLTAGAETFSDIVSAPAQSSFIDWPTPATAFFGGGQGAETGVNSVGQFSALLSTGHSGVSSAMIAATLAHG